eukprot:11197840-Lingulodinium_polyedra.AAC.1
MQSMQINAINRQTIGSHPQGPTHGAPPIGPTHRAPPIGSQCHASTGAENVFQQTYLSIYKPNKNP